MFRMRICKSNTPARPNLLKYAVGLPNFADKVQELAAEHGLTDHLSTLFRWKPELNMAIWKSSNESITRALAPAITAKPGRPSFTIEPVISKE